MKRLIEHSKQHPTMHYFGIPKITQSMIVWHAIFSPNISGHSHPELHGGIVVNMPDCSSIDAQDMM